MKRVLIVDDAIELGRLLQDALKMTHPDIPITVVPSAEEALLEATRLAFDLVVTDLRLPGISGLDLIRKIRVRQPNIKVILMTALMPEDRLVRQKDEVAPDIFMRKPITATAFLEAVESLIEDGPKQAPEPPPAKLSGSQEGLLNELAGVLPGEPVFPVPEPVSKAAQPPVFTATAAPTEGLGGILSHLRSSLGALSVMLLDERGRLVAQAGDLPDFSPDWILIPPLLTALSAGARVSHLLGQPLNQAVQAYRGKDIDLVLSPVGQFSLLVAIKPARSTLRLALAFEEALNAQAELTAALEAMVLHVMKAVEVGAPEQLFAPSGETQLAEIPAAVELEAESPLGQDPGLEIFEDLFTKKQTGQLRLQDADAFWKLASDEGRTVDTPGVLSYEQAQKLGLFPTEGKEQ